MEPEGSLLYSQDNLDVLYQIILLYWWYDLMWVLASYMVSFKFR
jgi:hypothetical protein